MLRSWVNIERVQIPASFAIGATVAERVLAACQRFAERISVGEKQGDRFVDLSYRDLGERVLALAASLRAHGVGHGDRVAIWLATSSPWIVADSRQIHWEP